MQVLDKPESGEGGNPPPPRRSKGLFYGPGRENRVGFFAGRFAFVIVGTMFVVMVLFSIFMLWVSMEEPYLQPYVENDQLYQDNIYLQVDGESTFRQVVIVTEPGNYDQQEITQIPAGKGFKVIFTPKQLEIPENYFITFLDGPNKGKEPEGGYTRQTKYLTDQKFYTLTVNPTSGPWPAGKYEIDAPSGSMFGGRNYAYFTVAEEAPKN